MLRYMQALVKVVVKNPLLWVLILVCQLLLVAPFIKGDATMGYFLGKEELDVALREEQEEHGGGRVRFGPVRGARAGARSESAS